MSKKGILRALDDLGRIVIPSEYRSHLNIKKCDEMEIWVEGDNIILSKDTTKCYTCKSEEVVTKIFDKGICVNCAKEFKNTQKIIDKLRLNR